MTLDPTPLSPRPKRSKAPFVVLFFLVLLLMIGAGVIFNIQRKSEEIRRYKWAQITLPERLARVPAPWSAATLSQRLKNSRKIRDAPTFLEAARQIGLEQTAPGGYLLPATAGPLDLARAFKAGPTHQKVTFPEGFTARQIGARLRKNGFQSGAALRQIAPAKIEGQLFPDTYWLPLKASPSQLTAVLRGRWQQEMKALPRPFPKVDGKELTPIQLVTLASLIEREAASKTEMPLVAGVFINRLRRPMRLQVDASIQYARALAAMPYKSRLLFADLEIDSPYNSYTRDGLPPTPICNPGAAALRAAARPAQTKALFYVLSPKLGHHLFAATFEAHKHNVALARQEAEARAKLKLRAAA